MLIVGVAWMFVVLLLAAAEATSPDGTVLGALFTLLGWGVLPLAVVLYVMGSPARRRARRAAELAQAASAEQGDAGGHAAGGPVAPVPPVREEP